LPTYRDYFAELKNRVKEATPQQVADLLRSGDVQLADVREKDEWDAGHLPGAVHVPKSYLEQWSEDRIPDKTKTTILYCAGGVRSVMAADTLSKLGYTNLISMTGGFNRWKDSGMATVTPESFTPEQAQRYSRHLLIPEVGEAGQHTLLRSKVLLIGEHRPDHRGLRRDHRRRGQFPDALSPERRVGEVEQARRPRKHLPLRRTDHGLQAAGRAVLSLPLPHAATGGDGAVVRRSRSARRAPGRDRIAPGE